jgi:hypothetical protein
VKPKKPRKTTLWYLGEILREIEELKNRIPKPFQFPQRLKEIKPPDVVPPAIAPYGPPTRTISVYGISSRDTESTNILL